jgi:hypothetical protein
MMLTLMMATSMAFASNPAAPLDGKSYSISVVGSPNYDLMTPDHLVFKAGKADAPMCHMYGFYATPYVTNEKDGMTSFSFICESKTEGSVYFSGVVTDSCIVGTYIWKKNGREDLEYKFEGTVN